MGLDKGPNYEELFGRSCSDSVRYLVKQRRKGLDIYRWRYRDHFASQERTELREGRNRSYLRSEGPTAACGCRQSVE